MPTSSHSFYNSNNATTISPTTTTKKSNCSACAGASYYPTHYNRHGDSSCGDGNQIYRSHDVCPPARPRTMRCGVDVDIPLPAVQVNVPCKVAPRCDFEQNTQVEVNPTPIKVDVPFVMKGCCGMDFETCVSVDFEPICLEDQKCHSASSSSRGGRASHGSGCCQERHVGNYDEDGVDDKFTHYFDGLSNQDFHRDGEEDDAEDAEDQVEDHHGYQPPRHPHHSQANQEACCRPAPQKTKVSGCCFAGSKDRYFNNDDYADYDDDERDYETFDSEADLNGWNSSDAEDPDFYDRQKHQMRKMKSPASGSMYENKKNAPTREPHIEVDHPRPGHSSKIAGLYTRVLGNLRDLKHEWPEYLRQAYGSTSLREDQYLKEWLQTFQRNETAYRQHLEKLRSLLIVKGNPEAIAQKAEGLGTYLQNFKQLRDSILSYAQQVRPLRDSAHLQQLHDKLTSTLNRQIADYNSLYDLLTITPRTQIQ